MHGRRIKDDEVITRCYCIRVRTTTSLSRKSPHCCQLAASLFLSFPVFPLHDRIISDDDATCRWRDDTFLEKIESSSHPSVIIRSVRVLQTRVRPLRIPRAIQEVARANVADRSRSRVSRIAKLRDKKIPGARSCALL